jgi:predicted dehydrogenase
VETVYEIRTFHDLQDALSQKPDSALICNPSSLHIPVSLACLRAGCDIFVEKPLSDSMTGVHELAQEAADRQVIGMVGYQLRFHPCFRVLNETMKSGLLGRLLAVRSTVGEYLPNWHKYEDYRQMYASRSDLGGGVILSQIHEFDYLYSLFGIPERVFTLGGHWSDLEVDVEDTATTLMEFRWDGRALPIQLHQDYLQSPPSRQCEIIGDRGRVLMDLNQLTVTVFRRGMSTPEVHAFPEFERNQLFLDQLKHFLDCVKSRKKPIVDLHDGIQSLRMALAAKKSLLTGQPVEMATV